MENLTNYKSLKFVIFSLRKAITFKINLNHNIYNYMQTFNLFYKTLCHFNLNLFCEKMTPKGLPFLIL